MKIKAKKQKRRRSIKSIRFEMVLAITLLSIVLCAAYYVAAMNLSKSAITGGMEKALSTISQKGADLVAERVKSHFEKLGVLSTNDILWSASQDKSPLTSLLSRAQKMEGYLGLEFADSQGNARTNIGATYSVAEEPGFQAAVAGSYYASDPKPVGDKGEMHITYWAPVRNTAGAIVGVLMQTSDGYELTDLIADITYGQSGYAFIVNGDGVMVAHPDRAMVLAQDRTLEKAAADPSQKGLAELLGKMIKGESGIGGYDYNGVGKFAGYAPIEGTNWYMALSAPDGEIFQEVYQLQWILLLAAAILALISGCVAFLIAGRIAKPMRQMVQVAEQFAIGDLNVNLNIRQNNEIGLLARAFQTVSDNMSGLIANIRAAAEQVAVGSRQIASSGMQVAQGTTEQASALEELSQSVEQIASQTRQNAGHASEANQLAESTRGLAERGNEKMSDMLRAMEDIDQSSGNIYRIIKVIDDIAFQTNILALNAAVEAARAGEHGRGFAVVAEEVRNLAAKSASAAKETSALIESSSKSVAGGAKLARETADSLKKIVDEINRVASLVHGISVASGEQSTGIEQINQGLVQISQVVQSNSATSQQTAASSRELTAQADALNQQVTGFRLKGETAAPARAAEGDARPEAAKAADSARPAAAKAPEPKHARPAGPAQPNGAHAAPAIAAGEAPAKAAPEAPAKAPGDAIPHSLRTAASAAVNAAFGRPQKISLGEEDDAPPIERPSRISLGEDDPAPARPRKISLSDSEFGKY